MPLLQAPPNAGTSDAADRPPRPARRPAASADPALRRAGRWPAAALRRPRLRARGGARGLPAPARAAARAAGADTGGVPAPHLPPCSDRPLAQRRLAPGADRQPGRAARGRHHAHDAVGAGAGRGVAAAPGAPAGHDPGPARAQPRGLHPDPALPPAAGRGGRASGHLARHGGAPSGARAGRRAAAAAGAGLMMDGTVSPGRQAAAGDDAPRRAPIDEALAPYEEALRAQLPGLDEILAAAAARRQRGRQRKRLAAGGTALAVAVLVAWLDPASQTEQFATAVGQRATWTLQDGSELRLNTGSRVTSSLHLRSRRFTIEQGEASFAVAHAPWHGMAPRAERSFTVRARPVLGEDIGAVCNVRLRSADEALVTVLHGRVRVSRPLAEGEAARELASGDSLLGRPGGFDTPSAGEAAQAPASPDR